MKTLLSLKTALLLIFLTSLISCEKEEKRDPKKKLITDFGIFTYTAYREIQVQSQAINITLIEIPDDAGATIDIIVPETIEGLPVVRMDPSIRKTDSYHNTDIGRFIFPSTLLYLTPSLMPEIRYLDFGGITSLDQCSFYNIDTLIISKLNKMTNGLPIHINETNNTIVVIESKSKNLISDISGLGLGMGLIDKFMGNRGKIIFYVPDELLDLYRLSWANRMKEYTLTNILPLSEYHPL